MATLKFKQLSFEQEDDSVKIVFLKKYYLKLSNDSLKRIGKFSLSKESIIFDNVSDNSARRKFDFLLSEGFKNLKDDITGRSAFYIHKNSGIPLIGSIYFGIVDKGSGMIELKPNTSCNMNCVFCSVDEGITSKRLNDYVIEREYIVEETKKLLEVKKEPVDIYINPHGEPFLYPEIIELCEDLSKLRLCRSIIIITAGTLLTKPIIDCLAKNKKVKINVSLHSIDEKNAKLLFGTKGYNLKNILEMLRYASQKMEVILAPVILPGYNDKEILGIVEFARSIKAKIFFQKYLHNKKGRNPLKEESWNSFFHKLETSQQETGYNLINKEIMEKVHTKELKSPFKSGEAVKAVLVLPGRFRNEMLAIAKDRIISVSYCNRNIGDDIYIKIRKTRHNLFSADLIK